MAAADERRAVEPTPAPETTASLNVAPVRPRLMRVAGTGVVRRMSPVLVGHPLTLVNAGGGAVDLRSARRYLSDAGWSLGENNLTAAAQDRSEIRYAQRDRVAALALARTVPFKVALVVCDQTCPMRLVVGRDAAHLLSTAPRRS